MAGRILVLDDEENYAEMLQDLLIQHNYRVDMATRPERAIDQLEEIPYDLVISDYKMPVMDGAEFLREARNLYPNLPFILVSGLMNTPELVKVANMGVTLVMEKPLDTTAFLVHVAKFAEQMTSEEKEEFDRELSSDDSAANDRRYPEEPRFFSAGCAASIRFMQAAWAISQSGTSLFILEPAGGDASLAVKDISSWRGNQDKPIQELNFEEFTAVDVSQIKERLADEEQSHVLSIRLKSLDQIPEAQTHLTAFLQSVDSVKNVLFVYVLQGPVSEKHFLQQADSLGCILPPLCQRPIDIAQYARRFARLLADRSSKPLAAEFTQEAVYKLLAFEWPRNYQQIQEVISAAALASKDEPIGLKAFKGGLGENVVPTAEIRLAKLVKKAQTEQLKNELLASGNSVEVLVRRLELASDVEIEDDLKRLPLLYPNLSNL
ncbi:MAG: response regulator [Opitutae bacterium]|jgi:DNA-binding NtrC family response regulator|nr:response regulator [Opitutae bacterium]